MKSPTVEEPLLESAPLARQLARQLCRIDPATGDSCAWIHGFWQYLRMLGLASTPGLHAQFFIDALKACASGAARPRVLISGAADYSMLSLVNRAFRERDVAPDITVVDQCETPLRLNCWYAERAGIGIATVHRDIFDYAEARTFDAVCTHSFFSEIPPGRWPDLLGRWRRLLRPGGVAITVNRVRPGDVAGSVGFTSAQAGAFHAAVLEKAQSLGPAWRADLLELAREAETYMTRRRTYPIRSREEIRSLFEGAGFVLDSLTCGPVTSGVRHDVSGPTTPGSADYARIVARCT
jgi:SAM-dependent methyltransferase